MFEHMAITIWAMTIACVQSTCPNECVHACRHTHLYASCLQPLASSRHQMWSLVGAPASKFAWTREQTWVKDMGAGMATGMGIGMGTDMCTGMCTRTCTAIGACMGIAMCTEATCTDIIILH